MARTYNHKKETHPQLEDGVQIARYAPASASRPRAASLVSEPTVASSFVGNNFKKFEEPESTFEEVCASIHRKLSILLRIYGVSEEEEEEAVARREDDKPVEEDVAETDDVQEAEVEVVVQSHFLVKEHHRTQARQVLDCFPGRRSFSFKEEAKFEDDESDDDEGKGRMEDHEGSFLSQINSSLIFPRSSHFATFTSPLQVEGPLQPSSSRFHSYKFQGKFVQQRNHMTGINSWHGRKKVRKKKRRKRFVRKKVRKKGRNRSSCKHLHCMVSPIELLSVGLKVSAELWFQIDKSMGKRIISKYLQERHAYLMKDARRRFVFDPGGNETHGLIPVRRQFQLLNLRFQMPSTSFGNINYSFHFEKTSSSSYVLRRTNLSSILYWPGNELVHGRAGSWCSGSLVAT